MWSHSKLLAKLEEFSVLNHAGPCGLFSAEHWVADSNPTQIWAVWLVGCVFSASLHWQAQRLKSRGSSPSAASNPASSNHF